MHISKTDIDRLPHDFHLNLINSITGIKPAHLIGTVSKKGISNAAIFSSVFHLGSKPDLIGFITRPHGTKQTYQNILDTGQYTLNHVQESIVERAHYTSAKFSSEESEFNSCDLTEEYIGDFKAPFVKESRLKIGLNHVDAIPIHANSTVLIIGEVNNITLMEEVLDEAGLIDLEQAQVMGVTGFNTYYGLKKSNEFPHAKVNNLPNF
jgi:flavin reductase (DIM6/NTAB) family NADH-FMN oxidoreductase RutF